MSITNLLLNCIFLPTGTVQDDEPDLMQNTSDDVEPEDPLSLEEVQRQFLQGCNCSRNCYEKLDENERLGDYWGEYAEIVARERNKEPGTF